MIASSSACLRGSDPSIKDWDSSLYEMIAKKEGRQNKLLAIFIDTHAIQPLLCLYSCSLIISKPIQTNFPRDTQYGERVNWS